MVESERIAIVPAGAFGTAMGIVAARNGHDVALYLPRPETFQVVAETRENPRLPGIQLSEDILVTDRLSEALEGSTIVVFAAPSHLAKRFGEQVASRVGDEQKILSLTKGLHVSTAEDVMVYTDMLHSFVPDLQTAALSGPNFAKVVAEGKEAVRTVIGSVNDTGKVHQEIFSTEAFFVRLDEDEVGVQVAGAAKNVFSLAVGMCEGAGAHRDALRRIVTRGPDEMAKLGAVLGARRETFEGIAGRGDLELTCTTGSRNYRAGIKLGEGKMDPLALFNKALGDEIVEGVHAAWAVKLLAEKHDLELPVMGTIVDVLYGKLPIDDAVRGILKTA